MNNFSRYNRQIILPEVGEAGQRKLTASRVLVVGAGGLGCPVLLYLTAAGVGTIGVCDFDTVSESNLNRQILYTPEDIGLIKCTCVEKVLTSHNPELKIEKWPVALSRENAVDIISRYDVVVGATDTFASRFLMDDVCGVLPRPFVHGAVEGFCAQMALFHYHRAVTYRRLATEQLDEMEPRGVIGAVAGMIGSMMAEETIKVLLGMETAFDGLLFQADLQAGTFETIPL